MPKHTTFARSTTHWENTKEEADATLPDAKAWLGRTLILNAPKQEDAELNVDLIMPGGDISVHCRWTYSTEGNHYFDWYWQQFTVRTWRRNNPTERQKIAEGLGDWLFYYWVHNVTKQILGGLVLDLNRLSECIYELRALPEQKNTDVAGSCFTPYLIEDVARRGCAVDLSFVDESEIIPGPPEAPAKLPANEYQRRQLINLVKANRPAYTPQRRLRRV